MIKRKAITDNVKIIKEERVREQKRKEDKNKGTDNERDNSLDSE